MIAVYAALFVACAAPVARPASAPPSSREAPFHGIELTVGEPPSARLLVDRAWLNPDGSGRGEGAEAAVPPELVVHGDRVSWDLKGESAVFEGSVRAVRGAVELRCERLEVRWAAGRVREAAAVGPVTITRGSRTFTAGSAKFVEEGGRFELDGDPVLRDGPHRMSGRQMVVFVDSERVECASCRLEVAPQ